MIADSELERQVLGGVLISDLAWPQIQTEVRLRVEDFQDQKHREIYQAMLSLTQEGKPLDLQLLASELNGLREYVTSLPAMVSAPGNVLHHAQRLSDLAQWHRRRLAALKAAGAASEMNAETWAEAQSEMTGVPKESRSYSPQQLADRFYQFLDEGGAECFPLPFSRLTDLANGGWKRGTVCIITGKTSRGKSVMLDQCLESAVKHDLSVHLYINEMTATERISRFLSRFTGVPYGEVVQGTPTDLGAVTEALNHVPYGMTECSGWSAQDICAHARANDFDVIGVDHLSLIDQEDERDVARISRTFNVLAKQMSSVVLAVCQLNRAGTLRGSGMLDNDADQVLMVNRTEDESGQPLSSGYMFFAKNRHGQLGGMKVHFNGGRMRFELPALIP